MAMKHSGKIVRKPVADLTPGDVVDCIGGPKTFSHFADRRIISSHTVDWEAVSLRFLDGTGMTAAWPDQVDVLDLNPA